MCFDTAASEIVNPAARAVTLASPRATCSKIARLVGSARAKNTRFSGLARYSTIWLNVIARPNVRQGGRFRKDFPTVCGEEAITTLQRAVPFPGDFATIWR